MRRTARRHGSTPARGETRRPGGSCRNNGIRPGIFKSVRCLAAIARSKFNREGAEASAGNGASEVRHQPLVEEEVVLGQQHRAQYLARAHQMVEIGARPGRAPISTIWCARARY